MCGPHAVRRVMNCPAAVNVMPPKKKSAIPDRWTDYSAVGKRIPGTRFIAFKVPLKQSLRNLLKQSDVFGPLDLLNVLQKEGQELGLIIDLTFTTRYYKPQDLPDSLYYLKIFTAGHEVPNDATILAFKKAVRRFLRDNSNNDKLIGVHCTHGLNRTGYLVCRYLIDVDNVEPQKAIELFNSSRGHGIERQNYLDDLLSGSKRSNAGMEEPDQEPVQGGAASTNPKPPFMERPHTYPPYDMMEAGQDHRQLRPHFQPFHQRGMPPPVGFGPTGLLPTPPMPPFSQAHVSSRRDEWGCMGGHPYHTPYPPYQPHYTHPDPGSNTPGGGQQRQRHNRKKFRHRWGKGQKNHT